MRLGLLVFLGGCDVVFGIGRVPDAGPPGPEAPDPAHVMGTYSQHWIENTGSGAPASMQRTPSVAQITMTATLDDGQLRPVTIDDAGNFTFGVEREGQPYALEVRSQYLDVEYQLAMSNIAIGERFAGRIDRSLVPSGTDVHMTVANRPITASAVKDELHTAGLWTRTAITTTTGTSFDLDWTTVTIAGGAMGLLDGTGTNHDAATYAHYLDNGSYAQLDAYKTQANVTLHPGPNTINFGAVTTATSFPLCVHLQAGLHAEAVRLAAANGSSTVGVYYGVHYIPDAEFATTEFPLAYFGTFGEIPLASVSNLDTSFQFINPYLGGELRGMTLIFDTSKLPNVGVVSRHAIGAPCPAPEPIEVGMVGIATAITLDGKPLDSNDLAITLPKTSRVELAWMAPAERVDYWIVHVQQVIGASNNSRVVESFTIYTLGAAVTLNTGKLIGNDTYRIQIDGVVGDASAASGDFMFFDKQSLFMSTAISGTFKPTFPQ